MSNEDIIEGMMNSIIDEQARQIERLSILVHEQTAINDVVRYELGRLSQQIIDLRSMVEEMRD